MMGRVRILLAGDWHGNRDWAERCFEVAAANRCPSILQLGDFGLWPGREDAWLDHLDALGRRTGVNLVWIDGNHENHAALAEWRADAEAGGLVAMRSRVSWAPRGTRWGWSGVRFGALGGAVSIDRFLRRSGVNWWPSEAPTQPDVDRLGDDRLDVLVTHAAPTTDLTPRNRRLPLPPSIVADIRSVRALLDQAVERTRPSLVVHGHYHVRLSASAGGTRVEGLAHDKSSPEEGLAVLDLAPGLTISSCEETTYGKEKKAADADRRNLPGWLSE
jgi:hypothetical protein